jgi:hypothetical protein
VRFEVSVLCVTGLLSAHAAVGQSAAIDNDRVTVWDIHLAKGVAGPATPHDLDTVVVFLEGGDIKTVDANGKATRATRAFGDAVFISRGSDARDTLLSDGAAHEIVVALKDYRAPPIANSSGYPLAYPRPGAVRALDNGRVDVWNYSWTPGRPTPLHFHDKDVVVAYRYDGDLKSVSPDGATVVNHYQSGEIRFNKANRSHSEVLESERQSAVVIELK